MRVNGAKVSSDVPLKAGDAVVYYMTKAQEERASHTVVYEDENVLVVDKESGVSSEALFCELSEKDASVRFLHRLDRNTEGLMIFARNGEAEEEILACFRERRVRKIYHALVFGKMPKAHGMLTARLIKDEKNARVKICPVGSGRGVLIETEYEVLEERGETSLLQVTLHTGRTHQIRAHLASVGCPVVGDGKYGDSAKNALYHAARQRLLSKQLTLDAGGALAYLCGKSFVSQKNL